MPCPQSYCQLVNFEILLSHNHIVLDTNYFTGYCFNSPNSFCYCYLLPETDEKLLLEAINESDRYLILNFSNIIIILKLYWGLANWKLFHEQHEKRLNINFQNIQ